MVIGAGVAGLAAIQQAKVRMRMHFYGVGLLFCMCRDSIH
jgi:hypothetical protein